MALTPLLDKKKCSVVVLESVSSVRQIYIDALKKTDYVTVAPFSDHAVFLDKISSDYYDWCIVSLDNLREKNISEWFAKLFEKSKNKNVVIGVIYDSNEDDILPELLELGILCFISKGYSVEPIVEQFTEFFNLLILHKGDLVLVSAEFVRLYLKGHKFSKSLLAFEESLLEIYPGHPRCLLRLAEALCLNGKHELAIRAVTQVEFMDVSLKPAANILRQKYLSNVTEDIEPQYRNILGVKSCIVVDPDTDVHFYITETLQKIGVSEIICFTDGKSAYDYLKESSEPKVILMEWKLPEIGGVALIQRIREIGFNQCHILIISSLVRKTEIPLLFEVGADGILEKPFDAQQLIRDLVKIVQSTKNSSEKRSLERKIRIHLSSNRIGEAERLIAEYISSPLIADAAKLQMQSEYEYANENFEAALDFALRSLEQSNAETVLIYSLLGKCYLKLRDFDRAQKCFEKAHKLSPTNVARILALVNLNIESGNLENALELVEAAKKIDATRQDVMETECALALEKSDTVTAGKILKMLDAVTGVVGMINNRAVARVRAGSFDEGIRLYNDALTSLPLSASSDVRELITYNLALAYARYGELEKSTATLSSMQVATSSKIFSKYCSLSSRMNTAIMTGSKLEFFESETRNDNDTAPEQLKVVRRVSFEAIAKNLETQKGMRCCFKIYFRVEAGELASRAIQGEQNGTKRNS